MWSQRHRVLTGPFCGLVGDASFHADTADPEAPPVTIAIAAMAVNLVVFTLVTWAVLG